MRLDNLYDIELPINNFSSFLQASLFSTLLAATKFGRKTVQDAHAGIEVTSWLEFFLIALTLLLFEKFWCNKIVKVIVVEYADKDWYTAYENGLDASNVRQDINDCVTASCHFSHVQIHFNLKLHLNVKVSLLRATREWLYFKHSIVILQSDLIQINFFVLKKNMRLWHFVWDGLPHLSINWCPNQSWLAQNGLISEICRSKSLLVVNHEEKLISQEFSNLFLTLALNAIFSKIASIVAFD